MTQLGFSIVETPGRMQPFAVWRGTHVWRFCETRTDAEQYILSVRARENPA